MAKTEKKKRTMSRKPKHSLDINRKNRTNSNSRSAATVRRLRMYKKKPMRNRKGKILKHEFQSKDLPNTRIQPDQRFFVNTRVVSQKDLEFIREELQSRTSNNYNVLLNQKKLPLPLLSGHKKGYTGASSEKL